ncbi:hypothetical protein IWX47DRAFT_926486, partial [Phyllosticta citricarpa]
ERRCSISSSIISSSPSPTRWNHFRGPFHRRRQSWPTRTFSHLKAIRKRSIRSKLAASLEWRTRTYKIPLRFVMSLKANPSQKRSKGDLPAPKIRSPSAKRPAAYEHDSKEFIDLTGPTPAPSEPDAEKEAQVTEQIEGTVQEMLEVAESACKSGKSAELMGPTLLGRAFRAFSELPLDSLTLVTINDLRDKIRYGRYNRETGAEPGESFAAAIAWETIAKQFPVLCVEFKTATWCELCKRRLPQGHRG